MYAREVGAGDHDFNLGNMVFLPKKPAGNDPVLGDYHTAGDVRPLVIVNTDNRLVANLFRLTLTDACQHLLHPSRQLNSKICKACFALVDSTKVFDGRTKTSNVNDNSFLVRVNNFATPRKVYMVCLRPQERNKFNNPTKCKLPTIENRNSFQILFNYLVSINLVHSMNSIPMSNMELYWNFLIKQRRDIEVLNNRSITYF